jgi:hypothetical protein
MVDGRYGIKDIYVVCKHAEKTVFGVGFMGIIHLPGSTVAYGFPPTTGGGRVRGGMAATKSV